MRFFVTVKYEVEVDTDGSTVEAVMESIEQGAKSALTHGVDQPLHTPEVEVEAQD